MPRSTMNEETPLAPSRIGRVDLTVISWYDSGKRLTANGGVMDTKEVPMDEERWGGAHSPARAHGGITESHIFSVPMSMILLCSRHPFGHCMLTEPPTTATTSASGDDSDINPAVLGGAAVVLAAAAYYYTQMPPAA